MSNTTNSFDKKAAEWDQDKAKIDRAEKVTKAITNQIIIKPNMKAIEYGCGTGLLGFCLQPYLGHITLADTSQGMLNVVKEKIEINGITNVTPLLLDPNENKVPENSFDMIFSLMTLHHIADTDEILLLWKNQLKSCGYLCIADIDKEDGSFHGSDETEHNGIDRNVLKNKLKSMGFKNIKSSTTYTIQKKIKTGEKKEFPVFLVTGVKK